MILQNIYKSVKNLQFIFRPTFWFMSGKYSQEWDTEFNKMLEGYQFKYTQGLHYASLGGKKIWIRNYPYGVFEHYKNNRLRPSRLTVLKAYKKLKIECPLYF